MNSDQRQAIVHARSTDYNNIMRTTLFTFLGIGLPCISVMVPIRHHCWCYH